MKAVNGRPVGTRTPDEVLAELMADGAVDEKEAEPVQDHLT